MPGRSWPNGSSRSWRVTRDYVLRRDGHRCQLKLDGCTAIAKVGHHTRPRELVGDNPAYVVGACENCNQKAGDPRTTDPEPNRNTWW